MALQEAPPFWWRKPGWQAFLFGPLSWVYGLVTAKRMDMPPSDHVSAPVICVGNFIAGGAGKTPTALAIAKAAKTMKFKPGILSRGYGGGIVEATAVNLQRHDSRDVGDEPLLMARFNKTVVSADRTAGARLLVELGCDLIIMDDGFQSPKLHKDYKLVVVDAKRGMGNGFTHPSGPLRVPFTRQLPHADTVLIVGEGEGADDLIRKVAKTGKPIVTAQTRIKGPRRLKNKKVLAYAGIADPEKFFLSLESVGADIAEKRPFGDHHHYHGEEIREMIEKAEELKLELVSTSKDISRLKGQGELAEKLIDKTDEVEIELVFENPVFLKQMIESAVYSAHQRGI